MSLHPKPQEAPPPIPFRSALWFRRGLRLRAFTAKLPYCLAAAYLDHVDQAAEAMKDAEIEAEIEDVLEGFNQPTWRGMRVNGERVPVSSSQTAGVASNRKGRVSPSHFNGDKRWQ